MIYLKYIFTLEIMTSCLDGGSDGCLLVEHGKILGGGVCAQVARPST